ncbi:hypothetical protein RchiOBHm_Chr2g0168791 [Rosa chinensis]|uniref:Uncharacterized protein n=1 Tax=Rosa chinensis TaxID=74649 RepID=A0A2P6S4Q6_ROSCH|nr:hypothetical protein RchiOBHm_Chr2g0168791 [Rosa chinensis]
MCYMQMTSWCFAVGTKTLLNGCVGFLTVIVQLQGNSLMRRKALSILELGLVTGKVQFNVYWVFMQGAYLLFIWEFLFFVENPAAAISKLLPIELSQG